MYGFAAMWVIAASVLAAAAVALACIVRGVQRTAAATMLGLSMVVPVAYGVTAAYEQALRLEFWKSPALVILFVDFAWLIAFCLAIGTIVLGVALWRDARSAGRRLNLGRSV